jgi:hypothetical protein
VPGWRVCFNEIPTRVSSLVGGIIVMVAADVWYSGRSQIVTG